MVRNSPLAAADDGIGQVLQALETQGQRDNTIVVFTSDNGGKLLYGASNGLLRSDKTHIYEGGIKVPWYLFFVLTGRRRTMM